MRVAVVGCGLIGTRRARIIRESPSDELVVVADIDETRCKAEANELGCLSTTRWEDVVSRDDVDAIVVSTVNKFLMPITIAAFEHGKHVLCEKPLGRNAAEADAMVQAAVAHGVVLKTGFNHRHHQAVWKAHELCSSDAIGPVIYIRAVYGHGGRPGYDKEWRADAELAGGGELLDQGVHIIDLCRWFLGDFSEVSCQTGTHFWKLGPLEDNAFALLRTSQGQTASFHTSWTQWKNRFSFEVFGRDGYLVVEGLGGSYGVGRLTWGRRRPDSGPPIEEHFEFPGADCSWQIEWQEFTAAVRERREPLASGEDGLRVMRLVDALYESSRTGRAVRVES